MAGKPNSMFLFLATCMGIIVCLASGPATADTVKMNVFERFRYEMTMTHDTAAPQYMSAAALAKWNRSVAPYFGKRDRRLSHFFAF